MDKRRVITGFFDIDGWAMVACAASFNTSLVLQRKREAGWVLRRELLESGP